SPDLIRRTLGMEGFAGGMTYTLTEAMWLVEQGITADALMGYPTVDRAALGELAARSELREHVTLMVDSLAHLDLLARLPREGNAPFQVCLDVDASLRLGPLHVGVRRSPVRTCDDAARLARAALARGINVRAGMFYDGQ